MIAIAEDPKHKDHFRACESLADRGGYAAQQNINVKHEHRDLTGEALMERIRTLAKKHGLDPEALLKGEKTPEMRVISNGSKEIPEIQLVTTPPSLTIDGIMQDGGDVIAQEQDRG